MTVLYVILRHFSFVQLGLLGQEIHNKAFLQERIPYIFLIRQDAVNHAHSPVFLAPRGLDLLFRQVLRDLAVRHSGQEVVINTPDQHCLFGNDFRPAILAFPESEHAFIGQRDLSICETFPLPPGHIL